MVRRCFLYWLKPVSVIIWNIFDKKKKKNGEKAMLIDWGKTYLVSSTFSKVFCSEYFFFNVHARIACNAKAFRNVVLNQSFKFFSLQPFKTVFQSSFLFLEQNIASFACTMEKCLSRLWIANLKEVFFMNLSPLTIRSSLFGWV